MFVFLLHGTLTANTIDSLRQCLPKVTDRVKKAGLLCNLSAEFNQSDADSAFHYAEKAYLISKQTKNDSLIAASLYQLGIACKMLRKFDDAIANHNRALELRKDLKDSVSISKSLNAMGVAYSEIGNYSKAISYLIQSMSLKMQLRDLKGAAITRYNIGNIYMQQSVYDSALFHFTGAQAAFDSVGYKKGLAACYNSEGIIYEIWEDYEKALDLYQKALDIEAGLQNYYGMINNYNNIGNIYSLCGMNNLALSYYHNALKYSEQISDNENIATSLKNIGLVHTFRADFGKANRCFVRSLNLSWEVNRAELVINVLHAIGSSYTFQGKCDSAVYYLQQSLEKAKEINYTEMVAKNYNMLAQAWMCKGNGTKAFECYQKYVAINERISKELANLKLQVVAEKKEKEIQQLSRLNELNQEKMIRLRLIWVACIIILLSLALLIIFILRNRIIKARHKASELKHRMLQLQMNPHFIHNTMASIEGYLFNNDKHSTAEYISEFSHLIRDILEHSREDFITLDKEILMLERYFKLQQLRFPGKFEYSICVTEGINSGNLMLPPMMAQPFVENSIEHGIAGLNCKGIMSVGYDLFNGVLRVTIEDNGKGFSGNEDDKTNSHKPLSISITRERLACYGNNKYSLTITGATENAGKKGTKVIILLPYKINSAE